MSKTIHRKLLAWFDQDGYRRLGYTLRFGGSGHLKIIAPKGRYVTTVAATPSDVRGTRNAQALLKRYEAGRQDTDTKMILASDHV